MDFIIQNKVFAGLAGLLLLLVLLCLASESMRGQLRKVIVVLLVVVGGGLGYYLVTGKAPSKIPGDINRYFSGSHLQEEPTHKYYRDPAKDERYKDQLK